MYKSVDHSGESSQPARQAQQLPAVQPYCLATLHQQLVQQRRINLDNHEQQHGMHQMVTIGQTNAAAAVNTALLSRQQVDVLISSFTSCYAHQYRSMTVSMHQKTNQAWAGCSHEHAMHQRVTMSCIIHYTSCQTNALMLSQAMSVLSCSFQSFCKANWSFDSLCTATVSVSFGDHGVVCSAQEICRDHKSCPSSLVKSPDAYCCPGSYVFCFDG